MSRPGSVAGRVLAPGEARGRALVLPAPISLWGGFDPATGLLLGGHQPGRGLGARGRVLVTPGASGSSSSASVLVESVRAGTAPAAIVLAEPDLILAIGATTAAELYGRRVPVIQLAPEDFARIPDDAMLTVTPDGTVRIGGRGDLGPGSA